MIRGEDLKLKISMLQINFQPMNKIKLVKLGGGFPNVFGSCLTLGLYDCWVFGMGFVCLSV